VPGIVTSRTRRLYQRPPGGPVCLNRGSPQAQGLLVFFPLNLWATTDVDATNSDRVLTPTNSPTMTAGPDGGSALNCVYISLQYARYTAPAALVDDATFAGGMTLACWYRITVNGDSATQRLVSIGATANNDNYHVIECRDDVTLRGLRAASSSTTTGVETSGETPAARTNEWEHACGTFATTRRVAYRNGSLASSANTASVSPTNALRVGINSLPGLSPNPGVQGAIAHACVWSRVLSEAEIWSLYDPATRWDLYYPLGRRVWSFATAAGPATTVYAQEGYRWRDDDGGEVAATWLDAQDTAISREAQIPTRLRILTDTSAADSNAALKLQWRKAGDPTWNDVGA
jgi:hypothetical protein